MISIPILQVKIADTPESQARGLMFIKSMPDNAGMLFIFSRNQRLNFWGENTLLPLDIAFADEKGYIVNIDRIYPLSRKSVGSNSPCKYAIEANAGFFNRNKIEVGDCILIKRKSEKALVAFAKSKSNEIDSFFRTSQIAVDDASKFNNLGDYFDYYDSQNNPQDNNEQNLPSLSPEELGQYLEDSMEDQQDMQEQEGLPQEEPPLPEELEQKTPEELEKEIPRFSNISDAFNWGQHNHKIMKITYQTKPKTKGTRIFGNNVITRVVEPHGRYTSRPENEPSHEILVTFDETVGGIRAFRMQNIKEFSFTGNEFKPKFVVR